MRLHGPMSRHTRRLMRGLTQDLRPRSILDVGCGEGSLLKTLADAHPDVAMAGVEIAEECAPPGPAHTPQRRIQSYGYRCRTLGAQI